MHVRRFVRLALTACLATACSTDLTSPGPRPSPSPGPQMGPVPTNDYAVPLRLDYSVDGIRIMFDSARLSMVVWDIGNGYDPVHMRLTPDQFADMVTTAEKLQLGDQNYDATYYINPYENRPGTWQTRAPAAGEGMSAQSASDPTATLPPGAALPPAGGGVLMRRAGDPSTTVELPRTRFGDGDGEVRPMWAEDQCTNLAGAIGMQRANYWSTRDAQKHWFERVAHVPKVDVEWLPDGTPTLKLESVQSFLLEVGMKAASVWRESLMLNWTRFMYNSWGCQRAITIGIPQARVFVGGYGLNPGGGQTTTCKPVSEWWEISFDGGRTWYPFQTFRTVCYHDS
jgi:hypothetical protein